MSRRWSLYWLRRIVAGLPAKCSASAAATAWCEVLRMLHTDLIAPCAELLRRHAAARASKCAFRDARRSVTYSELAERTGRLAGHLADWASRRAIQQRSCYPTRWNGSKVVLRLRVQARSACQSAMTPRSQRSPIAWPTPIARRSLRLPSVAIWLAVSKTRCRDLRA